MHADYPEYLTTAQAADYLNISKQWLEARRCRGGDAPPPTRIGRAVRYRRSALDAWMRQHESAVPDNSNFWNSCAGGSNEA